MKVNHKFNIRENNEKIDNDKIDTCGDPVYTMRNTPAKEQKTTNVNAILKGNDLSELVFNLESKTGSDPQIKKKRNSISMVGSTVEKIVILVTLQQSSLILVTAMCR